MKRFFRRTKISPEVLEARTQAQHALAAAEVHMDQAQRLGERLERIREKNHIVAAINMRKAS